MHILSNSAKFSAGRPILPAYSFFCHSGHYLYSSYRLEALASLNFLAIENVPPHFSARVYYGQTAGWIRIPLGTEVDLGPGDIVLDGDPAAPTEKGTAAPSTFRPMSSVAKRSPISATAEVLFGKAKFHYASWFEACRRQVRSQIPLRYLVRTSFEPAPNQIA